MHKTNILRGIICTDEIGTRKQEFVLGKQIGVSFDFMLTWGK